VDEGPFQVLLGARELALVVAENREELPGPREAAFIPRLLEDDQCFFRIPAGRREVITLLVCEPSLDDGVHARLLLPGGCGSLDRLVENGPGLVQPSGPVEG
jgi:hypothetical protein